MYIKCEQSENEKLLAKGCKKIKPFQNHLLENLSRTIKVREKYFKQNQ